MAHNHAFVPVMGGGLCARALYRKINNSKEVNMKPIEIAKEFILIFVVTFIVSSLVSFIYSYLVHSESVFDWASAFRLSIIFGVIFPWVHFRERRRK